MASATALQATTRAYVATLGLSLVAFRYLFGQHLVDPELRLIVFIFLVALGSDYNIFLMSRAREEALVARLVPSEYLLDLGYVTAVPVHRRGKLLTPATAMGTVLVDRLRAAGQTFTVEREDRAN